MHHGWLDEKSDENGIDGKHTVYIDIITFSYRHVRTSYLIPNSFFSRLYSLYFSIIIVLDGSTFSLFVPKTFSLPPFHHLYQSKCNPVISSFNQDPDRLVYK